MFSAKKGAACGGSVERRRQRAGQKKQVKELIIFQSGKGRRCVFCTFRGDPLRKEEDVYPGRGCNFQLIVKKRTGGGFLIKRLRGTRYIYYICTLLRECVKSAYGRHH